MKVNYEYSKLNIGKDVLVKNVELVFHKFKVLI